MSPFLLSRPGSLAAAALISAAVASPAGASVHAALPGESMWSIAQANGVSVYALAAANGRSIGEMLLVGDTLTVPAPSASASASSAGYASGAAPSATAAAAAGMTPVTAAAGTAYLAPSAASNLAALRAESVRRLGVDIYPAGGLSGYRTYAQQAELYREYLAGTGPLAAPPGTSAHETGRALDLASPAMLQAVATLGAPFGWQKIEASDEWWHVNYLGP